MLEENKKKKSKKGWIILIICGIIALGFIPNNNETNKNIPQEPTGNYANEEPNKDALKNLDNQPSKTTNSDANEDESKNKSNSSINEELKPQQTNNIQNSGSNTINNVTSKESSKSVNEEKENNITQSNTVTEKQSYIVYITKTGAKYHKNGCRYLKQSSISIDLNNAIAQGYEPCSVCNP